MVKGSTGSKLDFWKGNFLRLILCMCIYISVLSYARAYTFQSYLIKLDQVLVHQHPVYWIYHDDKTYLFWSYLIIAIVLVTE